tara:strand:- start:90 stop:623 length:534 start_codon:yes stop_codon:yes gene_type:complete
MKKLILLFLLSSYSFAQSNWVYFEEDDPFDGKIKYVTGAGENGYKGMETPDILIRRTRDKFFILFASVLDLRLNEECENEEFLYSYGNSDDVKRVGPYKYYGFSNDFVFRTESASDIEQFLLFLEDLKKHSKLYFRVICSGRTKNQFEFNLQGSTKALDQLGIEKVLKKRLDDYNNR